MPQTTVDSQQRIGFEGQLITSVDHNVRGVLRQFYNKSGAMIPFGRAVVLSGSSKTDLILPATTGLTPVGIAVINNFSKGFPISDSTQQGYSDGSQMAVLVRGIDDIVVWSSTAVDIDDPVYFRHANGVAGNMQVAGLGTFRNSTNSDYTLWSAARFITKTTAAGLAVINIGSF